MEQQSALNMEPIKITCPHCGEHDACFEETQTMPDADQTQVNSYMCMSCGYTSTTLNVEGSEVIKQYEEQTAELIKDLRWVDAYTNLVWYPIILNFPSFGIIFPDGTSKHDWAWKTAPAVDIPTEEQAKYPIPGQDGQFYARRSDMNASQVFPSNEFYAACKSIGFIQEK